MAVNHCLTQQSPHFETANKTPMAKGGPCTTSSISSNINSTSGSSLDNKFSMNLIKFPHHHNNLLGRGGAGPNTTTNADDEHQLPYSNQQQQQQLSYSGLGEAMHNENFKLESDQNDISSSLSHFNAPLLHHHHQQVANNASLPMHHHHHHQTRFDEVDEDGGDVPGLQHSTALDEGDKKFNQLQELENSLLMQNLQSNFLKKLDGYSHNPDYRSLHRRSGFIEGSGGDSGQNSNSNNYFHQHPPPAATASTNQLSLSSVSPSGGSNNPFHRKITTGAMTTTITTANKATSNVPAMNGSNNTFHVMNTSTSNQSIRNTTRNHIITDSLPGPESCV